MRQAERWIWDGRLRRRQSGDLNGDVFSMYCLNLCSFFVDHVAGGD
jgi:hypothetical protein